MSIFYAVVEDDPLDNGGNSHVMDGSPYSDIEGPDGRFRRQAYLGHPAWCSVCKSVGEIAAGAGISDCLRGYDEQLKAMEAVDGDIVLCKCERHPRVVSVYAPGVTYVDKGSASDINASASVASAQSVIYDEQFTLMDAAGKALPDTYYTIRMPSGALVHGVTDSLGRTARHETSDAQRIRIYLGHKKEA